MDFVVIRRGEIYFVSLDPVAGREQHGNRPVVVISDDAINSQPLVVTVVVGTDARNVAKDYPVNVRVRAAESGLPIDTVFLCFQTRSLDHGRFRSGQAEVRPAGILTGEKMAEVDRAVRLVLRL